MTRSIGRVCKRGDTLSLPILISREAWPYSYCTRVLCGGETAVCRIFRCSRSLTRPSLPVAIGAGSHPFPFRTRKLSLLPPMVLHGKLCGRVGRCRHYLRRARCESSHRAFFLYALVETRTHELHHPRKPLAHRRVDRRELLHRLRRHAV